MRKASLLIKSDEMFLVAMSEVQQDDLPVSVSEVPQESSVANVDVYTPGPDAVDLSPNKDRGVLKEIKREGTGEDSPLSGDTVFVHYVGRLSDGTQFDTSRNKTKKFKFTLGEGALTLQSLLIDDLEQTLC